jgi:cell division transport system permease protein
VRHAGFFIKEAFRSIRMGGVPVLGAVLVVFLSLTALGGFGAIGFWLNGKAEQVRDDLELRVYVKVGPGHEADVQDLQQRLLALPGQKDVAYLSPEDLRQDYIRKYDKDPIAGLPENPLPAAFEVKFENGAQAEPAGESIRNHPAVDTNDKEGGIHYGGQPARIIVNAARRVYVISGVLLLFLGAGCILLIANTIRLSVFARRREVEVMKLVGATNWFIRWPFVIEAVLASLAGAVLAVGALYGLGRFVSSQLNAIGAGGSDALTRTDSLLAHGLSFGWLALALLMAGVLVGAVGSSLTLGRYLRV